MINIGNPDLSGNELKYVSDCITSGWITYKGKYVGEFEKSLSDYLGRETIACSSGTGAIHLALLALGVKYGDEVVVPNITFGTAASCVLSVGAKCRLVDVNDRLQIDRNLLRKAINRNTKAILVTHLYGEDAGDFSEFGVPVIEDACEAFGYVEPRGDFTCYSFFGNKLITTGEGGALNSKSQYLLERAKKFRDGGFNQEYVHSLPGLNYRMTNMQAAVGLAQMERITTIVANRQSELDVYEASKEGLGKWLRVVRTDDPVHLKDYLAYRGVESRRVFHPLHLQRCFDDPTWQKETFPQSMDWWEHGLCLPMKNADYVMKHYGDYQLLRAKNGGSQLAA